MGDFKNNCIIALLVVSFIATLILQFVIVEKVVKISDEDFDYITRNFNTSFYVDMKVIDPLTNCPSDFVELLDYSYPGHESGCWCTGDKVNFGTVCSSSLDSKCDINISIGDEKSKFINSYPTPDGKYNFKICGKTSGGVNINNSPYATTECDMKSQKRCGNSLCYPKTMQCPVTSIQLLDLTKDSDFIVTNNILQDTNLYTVYSQSGSDVLVVLNHSVLNTQSPLSSVFVSSLPYMCQSEQVTQTEEKQPFGITVSMDCEIDYAFKTVSQSKIIGSQYLNIQNSQNTPLYNEKYFQIYQSNSIVLSGLCLTDPSNFSFIASINTSTSALKKQFIASILVTVLLSLLQGISTYYLKKQRISSVCYQTLILNKQMLLFVTHLVIFLLYNVYNNSLSNIKSAQCFSDQYPAINSIINSAVQNQALITKLQTINMVIAISLFSGILLINFISYCCCSTTFDSSNSSKPEKQTEHVLPTIAAVTTAFPNIIKSQENYELNGVFGQQSLTRSNTGTTALCSNLVSSQYLTMSSLKKESTKLIQ